VNHKPECNEKWEYDKDHCICNWIDKAERRIIKLLEDTFGTLGIEMRSGGYGFATDLATLIKGENK
jgi:hypothetical protein